MGSAKVAAQRLGLQVAMQRSCFDFGALHMATWPFEQAVCLLPAE